MRQLKGGKTKETRKEKRERKMENVQSKSQLFTIVLPTLAVIAAIIVTFVYINTRPKQIMEN